MRVFTRKTLYSPDAPDSPYLCRWTLFSCRWFQVLLHRFLRSDSAARHDHPWDFASLVLWRGYREELSRDHVTFPTGTETYKLDWICRRPFSIAFRRAEDRHRIELHTFGWNADHKGESAGAWTLVVTGRRRRDWFFYPNGVRVPWRVMVDYTESGVERCLQAGVDEAWFAERDAELRAKESK